MTALAAPPAPIAAWFTPSPALRLAQFEGRRPASAAANRTNSEARASDAAPRVVLTANRPFADLVGFLLNLGTSPFTARSGADKVVVAPALRIAKAARSTRELVVSLRESGMPISGIADVVGVQRKTVYSWLNEEFVADSRNHDRLQAVTDLLRDEPQGSLQFLTRHWERQLESGGNLKAILSADKLDVARAGEAMEWLRPAILRSMKQSGRDSRPDQAASSASSLTEYLEAVTK